MQQMLFDWDALDNAPVGRFEQPSGGKWISRERGFALFLLSIVKTSKQVLVRWSDLVARGDASRLDSRERDKLRDSAGAALAWICDDSASSVCSFRSVCELHDQDHVAMREAVLRECSRESLIILAEHLTSGEAPAAG